MKKIKLGLPFEYQQYPEYFNAMNIGDDTENKNALIERLLKKQHVHTVWDMTCGTGSQVFYLASKGYQVLGSDFSPDLLKIARKKARKEKHRIQFLDGDMRKIKVNDTFDAVITIFNAIGHLTKPQFEQALKNIHRHLNNDGIYIFDIFNLDAMNEKIVAELTCHRFQQIKDAQIHNVQSSTLDKKRGLLTSYNQCMIQQHANKPIMFNQHYAMQIYTIKELKEMLNRNGFKVISQSDLNGDKFIAKKSLNILMVAKKVSES